MTYRRLTRFNTHNHPMLTVGMSVNITAGDLEQPLSDQLDTSQQVRATLHPVHG